MLTVGTCSNCGGPVQVPELWGGEVPPQRKCATCGAVAKADFGPVIQMERPAKPARLAYRVDVNHCRCHPETCACNDWAVFTVAGEKHSTHFHRDTADEVANALNSWNRS